MKPKRLDPISGMFSTMEAIKDLALNRPVQTGNSFRVEKDNLVVDTCKAFDTGTWETGISQNGGGNWIIVEQYENEDNAKIGHDKWVKKMEKDPSRKLKDINVWGL